MRAAVVGALALGSLLLGASPAAALSGAEQIAFLNAQRAANGLPADIVEVPEWSAGCAKHMDYLQATGKFQHHEDKSDPQYSDEGDAAGNSSVLVSGGETFSSTGVNAFETAPIHLAQMLSPYLNQSGADRGCLTTLRDADRVFPAPAVFSYPGDRRTGVPTSEVSYEEPFVPAAAVGLGAGSSLSTSVQTGPSLYVFYGSAKSPGRFFGKGAITAASLTGPSGPVDVKTVDNTTPAPDGSSAKLGDYLPPGGIVIPVAPLQRDTTYTASVTFQPGAASGEPAISRTWKFSTGSSVNTGGGGGGGGGQGTPAPAGRPTVKQLKVKKRSVAFTASSAATVAITIDKRRSRAGKKPVRWSGKRNYTLTSIAGANRAVIDKLGKATYRVRVRHASATGKILAEKIVTLR